jgi:MFS family permease
MVSISVFANFLFAPLFSVIFPVYVKQLFDDATAFGALVASFGVGSVVGALATGAFGPRLPRYPIFAGGAVLLAAGLWALPWSPAFAVSLAAGFVMGLGIGPLNILATTIMQERVPEELLGRVFGTLFAMSTIASPLGVLLGGVAVDGFGITPVLVAIAFGVSVLAVWIIVSPAMRTAERPGTAIGNGQQATGGQEREVEL